MRFLIANSVSLACVLIAGLLCYHGKEGWGWFLFIALVAFHCAEE